MPHLSSEISIDNTDLTDHDLEAVTGGSLFDIAHALGFPSLPHLPSAPTPKSISSSITNYVVSHSPIGAIGHALKFW